MAEKIIKEQPIYRYRLEPYTGTGSRYYCPNCNKKGVFTRYVDIVTGEHIGDKFGVCNRKQKCGYSQYPRIDDLKTKELFCNKTDVLKKFVENTNIDYSVIEPNHVLSSLTLNDKFSKFIINTFKDKDCVNALMRYKVGESKIWSGATVFWQIDSNNDVRTGIIILYDLDTGKRVKDPFPHTTWEHIKDKYLKDRTCIDYSLKQVLFGTHLVTSDVKEVNIVESEKTAIICSLFSDKIWLACGGIEMISEARLIEFKDLSIVLHPDKGVTAKELWSKKISNLSEGFNVRISNYLDDKDIEDGEDLADILIKRYK